MNLQKKNLIQGEQSQLPELSRVIIAFGDQVVMEETLEEALNSIFSETRQEKNTRQKTDALVEEREVPTDLPQSHMIRRAAQLYNEAIDAQRQWDWATYGQKINELGELLNKLSNKVTQ